MMLLAVFGAGIGAGCWLMVRALSPRAAPLHVVVATLARPGRPAGAIPTPAGGLAGRVGPVAVRLLGRTWVDGDLARRLRLAGITFERHALDKLVGAVGAAGAATLAGVGLATLAIAPPPALLGVVVIGAGVGGFVLPDALLRDAAERRRRAFRHALSSYLDLVNVILAGGGGIETALWAAADAGDGWAFAAIRAALDRSRLTNRTPWDTFGDLGDDLGIDELRELAASVALAGSQGARIRQSLAAKADSLRGHQVAETEAAAEAATERMTIPVAVLLFGFLVFVAYPAIHQITSVSSNPLP